jgi:hypothetical protein
LRIKIEDGAWNKGLRARKKSALMIAVEIENGD